MPEVFELEISPVSTADTGWLGEDAIAFGPAPREWAWQVPNWFDPLLNRVPIKALLTTLGLGLVVAAAISTAHPSSTATATPKRNVSPVALVSPNQATLLAMVAVAESPDKLQDFTIADNVHPTCPESRVIDPAAAIASAVIRYQPSFALRDSSIGSEITGVCSAQLRFTGTFGDTLVVTILAPPNAVEPFIVNSANDRTEAVDVVTNVASWRIEIGLVGQPGTMLDELQLVAIATDARLRWA